MYEPRIFDVTPDVETQQRVFYDHVVTRYRGAVTKARYADATECLRMILRTYWRGKKLTDLIQEYENYDLWETLPELKMGERPGIQDSIRENRLFCDPDGVIEIVGKDSEGEYIYG